jgi:guanylate kinase
MLDVIVVFIGSPLFLFILCFIVKKILYTILGEDEETWEETAKRLEKERKEIDNNLIK